MGRRSSKEQQQLQTRIAPSPTFTPGHTMYIVTAHHMTSPSTTPPLLSPGFRQCGLFSPPTRCWPLLFGLFCISSSSLFFFWLFGSSPQLFSDFVMTLMLRSYCSYSSSSSGCIPPQVLSNLLSTPPLPAPTYAIGRPSYPSSTADTNKFILLSIRHLVRLGPGVLGYICM